MAGNLYWAIYPAGQSEPSIAEIVGQTVPNGIFGTDTAPTVDGEFLGTDIPGLSSGTEYRLAVVWSDGVDDSNVSVSAPFQTKVTGDLVAQETGSDSAILTGVVAADLSAQLDAQETGSDSATASGQVSIEQAAGGADLPAYTRHANTVGLAVISADQVSEDQTDRTLAIELEGLPAQFWTDVDAATGGDLRAYKADGTEIPSYCSWIDTPNQRGILWVKHTGVLSSSQDTLIQVGLDVAGGSYAADHQYGKFAVFADYHNGVIGGRFDLLNSNGGPLDAEYGAPIANAEYGPLGASFKLDGNEASGEDTIYRGSYTGTDDTTGADGFTLSVWVRIDSALNLTGRTVVPASFGDANSVIELRIEETGAAIYQDADGSITTLSAGGGIGAVTGSEYQHYVLSHNEAQHTSTLYLDGQEVASGALAAFNETALLSLGITGASPWDVGAQPIYVNAALVHRQHRSAGWAATEAAMTNQDTWRTIYDPDSLPAGESVIQETGDDQAAFNASLDIQGSIAVQEQGQDTAQAEAKATVSIDAAIIEQGADTATGAIEVAIEGAAAAQETGSDSAGLDASAASTGEIAARETGQDVAAYQGDIAVGVAFAAQEHQADDANISVNVSVTGQAAASETGADTATIRTETTTLVTLQLQEQGRDEANLAAQAAVVGAGAIVEIGQDDHTAQISVAVEGAAAAQEAGEDQASLNAGSDATANLAAQETGQDAAPAPWILLNTVAGSLTTIESGPDFASFNGGQAILGSANLVETGADSVAIDAENRVTGTISAQETGSDTANAAASATASATAHVLEQGQDNLQGQAENPVTGDLSGQEIGADIASIQSEVSDPAIEGQLAAREAGQDTAQGNCQAEILASSAARESGQDGAAFEAAVIVEGVALAIETGEDIATATAIVRLAAELAAQETGNDQANLTSVSGLNAQLAAIEAGTDSAVISILFRELGRLREVDLAAQRVEAEILLPAERAQDIDLIN